MENKESVSLTSTIKLSLFGKEFVIGLPTVGQQLQIESKKMVFSDNLYSEMAKSNIMSQRYNLDLVDSLSYFTVLIPDFTKKIGIESLANMDAMKGKEIVKVFRDQFSPWYDKFQQELHKGVFDKEEIA